ncbi:shieldin complex subunit 3 [Melanotaenia boesemani]|uniref:shieldin complex subunit 3 n=1 Tax=Melanotaenia boesemani TaxID=1250792 RepID=UPI001C03E4EC|nr:shieldin complex subunit 3 [Melanotaenia boesemani]
MEDVVLHYQPGSANRLSSLLDRTAKLLGPFPCRTPPVFTPWFPTVASDCRLPIRPAKPAPIIASTGDLLSVTKPDTEDEKRGAIDRLVARKRSAHIEPPPRSTQQTKDAFCISETPNHPLRHAASLRKQPQPVRRSWSVFTQRGVLLQSSETLSKCFRHMMSVHRLHLRQRAKWVISEYNCSNIEKTWCSLNRSVRTSRLPTCNANIQRDRAEIWVFCDVAYSEQVGHFLKEELQLSGSISLSVHRLGNIFSM